MKENIPNLVGFKISRPVLNSILNFGTFLGSFDQLSVRKIANISVRIAVDGPVN